MKIVNSTTVCEEITPCQRRVSCKVKREFYQHAQTGNWLPINCMPINGSDYYFSVREHDLHIDLAPRETGLPLVRFRSPKDNSIFALWLKSFDVNENYIIPEIIDHDDNSVQWQIDSNSLLRLIICGHRIEKHLVLQTRPCWNSVTFSISHSAGSLTESGDGFLEALDCSSRKLFGFEQVRAWDANGDAMAVDFAMAQTHARAWELTIFFSPQVLDNAIYPVIIDPCIALNPVEGEAEDTRIAANVPNAVFNDAYLTVWKSGATPYAKSLLRFAGIDTVIARKKIIDARLALKVSALLGSNNPNPQVVMLLSEFTESEANWIQRKLDANWGTMGCDKINTDRANFLSSPVTVNHSVEGHNTNFDVRHIVARWASNSAHNFGFVIVEGDVPSSYVHWWSSNIALPDRRPSLVIDFESTQRRFFSLAPLAGANAQNGSILPGF